MFLSTVYIRRIQTTSTSPLILLLLLLLMMMMMMTMTMMMLLPAGCVSIECGQIIPCETQENKRRCQPRAGMICGRPPAMHTRPLNCGNLTLNLNFDLLNWKLAHQLLILWERLQQLRFFCFFFRLRVRSLHGTGRRTDGRTGKTRNAAH